MRETPGNRRPQAAPGSRAGGPRPVPVVLLTGVGMAAAARLRTLPLLEEHFQVLALEATRPAGPSGAQRMAQFADEVATILDDAGVAVAHVYGLSFGGMIAQELALRHPQRVGCLVLGATSAGGPLRTPPDALTDEFLRRRASMPADEGVWAAVPYSYALATRRRRATRIGEDIIERVRRPVHAEHHDVQRAAALEHDAAGRLPAITAPTLVVHGDEDRMVPPANGRALARVIPGARLQIVAGAGHMYPTDAPEADAAVVRFLRQTALSAAPPAPSGGGRAARA